MFTHKLGKLTVGYSPNLQKPIKCSSGSSQYRRFKCAALPGQESNQESVLPFREIQTTATPLQESIATYTPSYETQYTAPTYVQPMYSQPYQPQQPMHQSYAGVYPSPHMYPVAPGMPTKVSANDSSSIPWWILFALGALGIKAFEKIQELVQKGPQQMVAEMAMKQMMASMPNNSPFGQSPGGFPSYPPFASPATPPSRGADVETTAVPPSQAADGNSAQPGQRFASRMSASRSTSSTSEPKLDVVDPVVREPPPVRGSSGKFFSDISDDSRNASSSRSGSAGSNGTYGGSQQASSSAGGAAEKGMASELMEQMLRNPSMQQMLYPYMPENMRNPESFEFMLSNPEIRKQMEKLLEDQGVQMTPEMMKALKNIDLDQETVNRQFAELGMTPDEVMRKVMANPELAAGFSNPKVQAAIIDISSNPMNITKYQNDPEILKVLEKVSEVFTPPGRSK